MRAFAEFLSTPAGIEGWTKLGGAVSANTTVAAPSGTRATTRPRSRLGLLANATDFRFDASDLMPAAVGAGSFWTGMVDWIAANGENTDEVLQAIDDSWPS